MNIFALDKSPNKSAQYMINRHVTKMVTESAQLMSNAYTLDQLKEAPKTQKGTYRKHSYPHHPSSKWTIKNIANFSWVLSHADALVKEGLHRGFNLHFCYEFIDWCSDNVPDLPDDTLLPFALAMPDKYKTDDPIESYRQYYIHDKQYDNREAWMMKYTNRDYPDWFPEWLLQKCRENNV